MLTRILGFSYGVVSYIIFFATFLYAIGFIGGLYVPTTLDGPLSGSLMKAVFINIGLLGLFAIQHSVMARPAFKRAWTKVLPKLLERSTYVLFSSIALILLFIFWQPMGGIVWDIENTTGRILLYTLFTLGWGLILAATFVINHFDLFGLRQSWLYLRSLEYTPLEFNLPLMYKIVRHPLYVGWFIAFWATPTMSVAHFLFATVASAYILIAIGWEEKDLCDTHPEYEQYRQQTPMLIPKISRK